MLSSTRGKKDFEKMRKCQKMNLPKVFSLCLLVAVLSLALCSCGGKFRTYPGEGDISGTWNLVLTKSNVTVRETQLFIIQKDRYDEVFSGTTSDSATLTGTLSGNSTSIILNNSDGSTTTLTGTLSDDWKAIRGTYTSTGPDGSGTWSALRPGPGALSVAPANAALSCSEGQSATFTATGGTRANYTVVASTNGSLVTLSTTALATNGQFTVTANTSCAGSDGTVADIIVSDTSTSITIPVTISNP